MADTPLAATASSTRSHATDPRWWSSIPGSTSGIDRVDEVHDALVADLERLKLEPAFVVPAWVDEKRQLAFDLARAADEAHEEMKLPELRAGLHALDGRAFARRYADVTDQLDAMLKWVPLERMRHLNPAGRGPAFLEDLERPYIAYLAVTRPTRATTGRGVFERVRSFVWLSVEAVELEREHIRRQPEIMSDATIPALVLSNPRWAEHHDQAWSILQAMLPNRRVRAGAYGGSAEDRHNDFQQALRLRLLELINKLKAGTPGDMLAKAYDGALKFLPASAEADFRNDRAKERNRERILPTATAGDTIEKVSGDGAHTGEQTRVDGCDWQSVVNETRGTNLSPGDPYCPSSRAHTVPGGVSRSPKLVQAAVTSARSDAPPRLESIRPVKIRTGCGPGHSIRRSETRPAGRPLNCCADGGGCSRPATPGACADRRPWDLTPSKSASPPQFPASLGLHPSRHRRPLSSLAAHRQSDTKLGFHKSHARNS